MERCHSDPHSMPGGGGNTPVRCLSTANKISKEEAAAATGCYEVGEDDTSAVWKKQTQTATPAYIGQ